MAKKLQIVSGRPFQADWNVVDENDMAYIRNKPNLLDIIKTKNIILYASSWGDDTPHSQSISVDATPNSKIDIQPNVDAMMSTYNGNYRLLIKNDNGNVIAYAIGDKPLSDLCLQLTVTEVAKENELDVVWGNVL